MTRKPETLSLRERVRRWVVEYGPCSARAVAGAVGRFVSSAQALAAGRSVLATQSRRPAGKGGKLNPANGLYTTEHLADLGRRRLVQETLRRLHRDGRLSRPSRGVYGPPPPKLYRPAEAS